MQQNCPVLLCVFWTWYFFGENSWFAGHETLWDAYWLHSVQCWISNLISNATVNRKGKAKEVKGGQQEPEMKAAGESSCAESNLAPTFPLLQPLIPSLTLLWYFPLIASLHTNTSAAIHSTRQKVNLMLLCQCCTSFPKHYRSFRCAALICAAQCTALFVQNILEATICKCSGELALHFCNNLLFTAVHQKEI